MTKPDIVASGTTAKTTGTTLAFARPGALAAGDIILVAIRDQTSAAASDYACPGFTRQGAAFVPSSAANRVNGLYTKLIVHVDDEPATYTFTGHSGASTTRGTLGWAVVRPVDPDDFLSGAYTVQYAGNGITNGTRIPAYQVSKNDSLQIVTAASEFSPGQNHVPVSTPAGMTEVFNVRAGVPPNDTTVSRTYLAMYKRDVDAGPTVNEDTVWSIVSGAATQSIAFGPAPDPEPPPGPFPVSTWDGVTEEPAVLTLDDENVRDVLGLPVTTYTVSEMMADLQTPGQVFWAHRGGSLNFSEMTMRAYTNALWHGAKVLEVSVWKSSDGVFVMHHDDTLDRVTALTGTIASKTWAQLAGVAVDTPFADGGVLGRLEDLLATYGQTHVLVIEDKPATNKAAITALVESFYDSPAHAAEHVVWKIYGDDLTRAVQWEAQGYVTWPYLYDAEILSANPTQLAKCSTLGINWNASPSNFDAMLAYGKPIVAHIISNPGEAATALSRGASGLQCSNVLGVVPKVNDLP